MQLFARLSRPEKLTANAQIVVVEVPYVARPGIVEHPLNQSSRCVFVAGVSLKISAMALIESNLRFVQVLCGRECFAIAGIQRRREKPQVVENPLEKKKKGKAGV